MKSSALVVLAVLFAVGCAPKAAPPAATNSQNPPPQTSQAEVAPVENNEPEKLPHITMQEAMTAMRTLGYKLEDQQPVDKASCRTDRGCVQGVMTTGLMIVELDANHEFGPQQVAVWRNKDENPDGKGSVVVAHNIVLVWVPQVSYEDEEAARAAITRLR